MRSVASLVAVLLLRQADAFSPGRKLQTVIPCEDTYQKSDPLQRTCAQICRAWNYKKQDCCESVFAPTMHLAGKCVKYCDQCGLDLPMSIPDPKCKDNYLEPGCKVMCERYWGFKTPATCCPNNFAKSGTASTKCDTYCGYCNATVAMTTVKVAAAPPPPPPPQPGCDAGGGCGRCLMSVKIKANCPETAMKSDAPNCQNATLKIGDFCEADDECDTKAVDNCDGNGGTGWDIYYIAKDAEDPAPPNPAPAHVCGGGQYWAPYSSDCPALCSGYQPGMCYGRDRNAKGACQCKRGYLFDDAPGVNQCKKCPNALGGGCQVVCTKVSPKPCTDTPKRMDCTCPFAGTVQVTSATPPWTYSCSNPCDKSDSDTEMKNSYGLTCAELKTRGLCDDLMGKKKCPHACGFCPKTTAGVAPDPCQSRPCQHGGVCTDKGKGVYRCNCNGFTGTNCEEMNECASAPCKNGAVCVDGKDSYSCSCPVGLAGEHCEEKLEADPCNPNPCALKMLCSQTVQGFTCLDVTWTHAPTQMATQIRTPPTRKPTTHRGNATKQWTKGTCMRKLSRACSANFDPDDIDSNRRVKNQFKKCCGTLLLATKKCQSFIGSLPMIDQEAGLCLEKVNINIMPGGAEPTLPTGPTDPPAQIDPKYDGCPALGAVMAAMRTTDQFTSAQVQKACAESRTGNCQVMWAEAYQMHPPLAQGVSSRCGGSSS